MISNITMNLKSAAEIEENILRHMVLNSLRSYNSKFRKQYGEMVIACDNRNYWRKSVFPYYKANRKKAADKSPFDWKKIYEIIYKIKDELKENFPYRIIEVESAEADDIIGTLCRKIQEQILIVSADRDFQQLQKYQWVNQYDPIRGKHIKQQNPKRYLIEHILSGDSGDGVPNVLSPDNCFVIGQRQTPLRVKKLEELAISDIETLDEKIKRNYYRNSMLIDLSNTPDNIAEDVLKQYENQAGKKRDKLLPYFMKHRLKQLTSSIGDF